MKTKEEIEKLAEKEYPIQLNENHYKPDVYDDLNEGNRNAYVEGYTQCQEDMARNQPEDIWNKESQDKIKEDILNRVKKQTPEDILETELASKKYTEEDVINDLKK